jgi:hypothetical protein
LCYHTAADAIERLVFHIANADPVRRARLQMARILLLAVLSKVLARTGASVTIAQVHTVTAVDARILRAHVQCLAKLARVVSLIFFYFS